MNIANGTWVLVADGSKFLLLRNQGDTIAPVLATLEHEELTNPPTSGQGSDRPGRSFSSNGGGNTGQSGTRSSSYGETDWHRQAEERFAAHTADILNRTTEHEKGAIVVIAAAQTLGELRKHYSEDVAHRVQAEITKDLAGHTTDDIVEALLTHVN